jgi:hypothetical protein
MSEGMERMAIELDKQEGKSTRIPGSDHVPGEGRLFCASFSPSRLATARSVPA